MKQKPIKNVKKQIRRDFLYGLCFNNLFVSTSLYHINVAKIMEKNILFFIIDLDNFCQMRRNQKYFNHLKLVFHVKKVHTELLV